MFAVQNRKYQKKVTINEAFQLHKQQDLNNVEVHMHFKLLIAYVEDSKTDKVMEAAREAGATGATIINNARGEGLLQSKTFFGLSLETQRDVIMFLVEQHLSRHILEKICLIGEFETSPGTGIAIQIDVEDAVGVSHQIEKLVEVVESEL